MKSEEISVLKFENHPNTFLCKGENLKKEKSLKSNYSNSSSVETQFDSTENTQQKTITSTKDNESVNEVSTLINYNLSRKSSKMENPIMEKPLNESNGESDTITSIINKEKSDLKVNSLSESSEIEKDHSIDMNKTMNNNSVLSKEQNTESSLVTNSLDSKPLTESPKTANADIESKNIFNSSYFTNSTASIENAENGISRSESLPSVLKNDPKSKLVSSSDNPPVKSNSQPPIPSTTFSNFKDKNSLNRIKKKEVIKELMESERLYVSDLQMLIENCFNPLEAVSWLPLNEKCLIIRNIQELFVFQQEFLEDMEASVKNLKEQLEMKKLTEEELNQVMNECIRKISDCFIRRKKKFKVYSEFCSLHQEAINIFREYEYKPEMISFIRDFNGKTHSRLHLQDFLIKPVQRICKYPLLLKELIHYSDKDCEELNGLKEALTVMSEVAREIDHVKWLIERVQRTDKFIDRLDIQDQFKYIIMERYGDMILSTGLEVVMEKERVNYRGVFLFRKHMFIVKPKRSRNYRVKMHLILDEFYFEAYPEYNAFRLIQKNTGIIIDFFAFSTIESKIWIELMETLVDPLEEIADKNKVFYIKSRNSYESHFSRFSLELKNLSNHHPVNQKNNSLRRAASSSLVNSSFEFLHPLDANSRAKRDSFKSMSTSIEKRESVGSSDSYHKEIDSVNNNNGNNNNNSSRNDNNNNNNNNEGEISLTNTPKVNPIHTSTFTTLNSKRNTIQNINPLISKKSFQMISNIRKQNLHNTSSISSIKCNQNNNMMGTSGISTTADTEISSNGSDILYYDNGAIMDHELIISEPSVATTETHLEGESGTVTGSGNENRLESESGCNENCLESESGTVTGGGDSENHYRIVSEPESFKSLPKKLDINNDTMSTISKTDSISTTTTILPPKYKLIDSKFYDVYTYLFTNNDIQKIFSNLMYHSHEFDHLLYHKKTTRTRSNSCPRERYLFRSKERREKEKRNSNCSMVTLDDKNNFNKSDNRSSLYIPVCSDNRSIKSSRSSVNLYHNEEVLASPSSSKIFKHTRSKNSVSSIRKMTTPIPSQNISSTPVTDDSSIHSVNSLKYRKRHSISIFKSNSAIQPFEPSRFVAESQITVTDSPLSRCYSSLSDKMIDQDINFYFENMQNYENSNSTNLRKNSVNSVDTLSLNDLSMNHTNNINNNTNINSNINTNINTNNNTTNTNTNINTNTNTNTSINVNTNDHDYHLNYHYPSNNNYYSNFNYNINHTNMDINNIISSHGNGYNNSYKSPKAVHRQTVAIMDTNTLNSLYQLCNNDEDDNDSVSQNGSIKSFSMKDENNDNHRNSYYQNRHSIAVDLNNMSSRSYDKVKNKKEKKIHFGNIKKIFAVGSRRSSSSSTSSSSSSLSKSSSFIFPKYSSENNLKKFTSKAFRSPTLSSLNRFSSSKNHTELGNLSTPVQYSKSPLVENVVINYNTSSPSSKSKNEKEQKISSSNEVNTMGRSSLYEEEEEELEEFNSMEHLGEETDQEPEPEFELESKLKSKSKTELKLESPSKSQLQSKSTSEIDFHEEIKKLSSSSSSSSNSNSNSSHDLSTVMEESKSKSYQSQQFNVDTTTSIHTNNLALNKNQDQHLNNSLTSSHSNNNEQINTTIFENTNNISDIENRKEIHDFSNPHHNSKTNLNIMKEIEKDENKNNNDDDDNNNKNEGTTLKENRNNNNKNEGTTLKENRNNNNISNNNLTANNTNHSIHSTSNSPLLNNNNLNVTSTSTRSHLKRNKTISLKLINLKKIF
ncbi:hypothetical protein H8356DRAFT_41222 [Neocallimastix lanati (nom. inval.)]|jgi:hypothetical protein|nr:hypothetical protein H8356DRAFT_41222 [Neocallimastix sp. JGI-2020a]